VALPPERFEGLLRIQGPEFGLPPAAFWPRLALYLSELSKWRLSMNLTGRLSPETLSSHALEAVLGETLIVHGARVIDIGSGAGLPGVPLAIARSDLSLSLLEPRAKRAAFLRHVARALGLSNAEVIEGRVEEVGGQTFDIATVRAVGNLADSLLSNPLLRSGGALLAWVTEPERLAKELAPRFTLERALPIPGSRQRSIALYRAS